MLVSIFMVPLLALLIFMILGNDSRSKILSLMGSISLIFIVIIAGLPTLIAALALILPVFFVKEVLIKSNSKLLFWLSLVLALLSFALLKNYFELGSRFVELSNVSYFTLLLESIGLSFIFFRSIEYLVISPASITKKEGGTSFFKRLNKYIGFCLAFPSFTSGPITRWNGYSKDYASNQPIFDNTDDLKNQLKRIANGLFKISVISQPLLLIVLGFSSIADEGLKTNLNYLLFILVAFIFYLYFLFVNFSAFSDVMIGSARFVGLRLPENFDHPFTSTNFLDFWTHWHMSVSQWFRDFLFSPTVKFFVLKGVKSNFICSGFAYFLTFGLLGLWHGRTWPFLICGLLLALGALYNQIFREFIAPKFLISQFKGWVSKWVVQIGRSSTYLYIAIAISGLWLSEKSLAEFWANVFSIHGLVSFLIVVIVFAIVLEVADSIGSEINAKLSGTVLTSLFDSNCMVVSLVKVVVAILIWFILSTVSSSFVYEGF